MKTPILKHGEPGYDEDLRRRIAEWEAAQAASAKDELKQSLKVGEQIIAIADARFSADINPDRPYSQRVGDIIMVNNPKIIGMVGGNGVKGHSYTGRSILGLGSSLNDGTYRRATPDDEGYLATKEQWHGHLHDKIKRLTLKGFITESLLICLAGLSLYQYLAGGAQ